MAKVDLEKFLKEELEKIVLECFDKTELASKLGFTYFNGKVFKKIVGLLDGFSISIDHFDSSKKTKARRIYPVIKKICPICIKEFETEQGHPKEKETCSHSCSNIYFAASKHTTESNLKRSKALNNYHLNNLTKKNKVVSLNSSNKVSHSKECKFCKCLFKTNRLKKIFCSQSCATKFNWSQPGYKETLTAKAKQRVINGQHKGWSSRKKIKPSFPEQITMEILSELNIQLEREHKCGRWFIDFADLDRKIALEIDGRQHELPERKASDEQKDKFLIEQGWQVFRIKWRKLNVQVRQELKEEISKIFLIK